MRTHYCGEVTEDFVGQLVELYGWVHRRRDLGGVIFIDLRDREGIVQIIFDPKDNQDLFNQIETVRHEYVLCVKGIVHKRPQGTQNLQMETGTVEIRAKEFEILNTAETPPFPIDQYVPVHEEIRLKYRYLDLRRPEMNQRLRLRAKLAKVIRAYLDDKGFIEIETPVLTKATPEGARDYLVPSRVQPGKFYALPQSPQLFKQLLMMAGMDRYYQIVKCFRDEDLRADRQPEFTQLDLETSFLDEKGIQEIVEGLMRDVFKQLIGVELKPFPRMTYAEAMRRFGSDKPDLRIDMELIEVTDLFKTTEFKLFAQVANQKGGRIAVLRLPRGAALISRKQIDEYNQFVQIYGTKGLVYLKVNDLSLGIQGIQSSMTKFLSEESIRQILDRTQAKNEDILFFCADKEMIVNLALGALRVKLAEDHHLIKSGFEPLWVTDFPMFESVDGQWQALHHPFTSPDTDDITVIEKDPGSCLSRAWDIVINGSEIGSGSIRIRNLIMQQAIFRILGLSQTETQQKFGFLLEAMKYGCPPHGGMGIGFGRIVMLLSGATSLRDVTAFPKTTTASCPLTDAPSEVSEAQLRELKIKISS